MLSIFFTLFLTFLFLIYKTRHFALKIRIKLIFSGFFSVIFCILIKRFAVFLRDINQYLLPQKEIFDNIPYTSMDKFVTHKFITYHT